MSTPEVKSKSVLLLYMLLGVTAFSLSNLPGSKWARSGKADLASNSCDWDRLLENDDSAACTMTDDTSGKAMVTGKVSVHLDERTVRDRSKDDASSTTTSAAPATKKVKEWVVDVDVETECKTCGGTVRPTEPGQIHIPYDDLKDIGKMAQDLFDQKAQEVAAKVTKAKEAAHNEDLCITHDGEKLSAKEVVTCRIAKLQDMDPDKAAQYYQDNVQDEIEALVQSDDPADRARGEQLLKKLGRSHNSFIKQNAYDLTMFGQYQDGIQTLSNQLSLMSPADPRARQMAAQLVSLKSTWGSYFQQRMGLESKMMDSTLGNFPLSGYLTQDLSGYQDDMSRAFNSIAATHAQYVNALGGTFNADGTVSTGGDGRTARGMVSTSYANSPSRNTQQNNLSANTRKGAVAGKNGTNTTNGATAAASSPLNGSSIIKPSMGSPVSF